MLNKVALSILFTANGIHNVNAQGQRGDICEDEDDCYAGLFCHTQSINGIFVHDPKKKKWERTSQKICVEQNSPPGSKVDLACISDHECDYHYRSAATDQMFMSKARLICYWHDWPHGDPKGKCEKPTISEGSQIPVANTVTAVENDSNGSASDIAEDDSKATASDTPKNDHGKKCGIKIPFSDNHVGKFGCDEPYVCHTQSLNGMYVRATGGDRVKDKSKKICVLQRNPPESKGKDCISDHECDYEKRHASRKQCVIPRPRLICDGPAGNRKCVTPPPNYQETTTPAQTAANPTAEIPDMAEDSENHPLVIGEPQKGFQGEM